MPNPKTEVAVKGPPRLSLDTWAVIVALVAAALLRFGLIPKVPW